MLEPLYPMLSQDIYQAEFTKVSDFQEFLEQVERLSEWQYAEVPSMYLSSEEEPGQQGQLMLHFNGCALPVRSCAFKSLQDRAKVSGAALVKLEKDDPEKLAYIYNICLDVARGKALVRICADKVSAVLGGDPGDYAILPIPKLFETTHNYLVGQYQGQFLQGTFEHHLTTAVWSFRHPDLLKSYIEMLARYGQKPTSRYALSVRFASSDTGVSSVNLYPRLTMDDGNMHSLALGTPLSLPHKNGSTEQDYVKLLPMLFSHFQKSLDKLTDLFAIPIDYPAQTILHVAKRLTLPRKLTMQTIEAFLTQTDNQPCTAHDCYYWLNEIIFLMQCDCVRPSKIIHTSEMIARSLTLRWRDYDYYSDIVW